MGSRLLQQGSRPDWRTSLWLCKKQISGEWPAEDRPTSIPVAGTTTLAPDPAPPASSQTSMLLVRHLPPAIRHIASLCRDPRTRNSACGPSHYQLPSETTDHHPCCGQLIPPPHRTSDRSLDTYPLTTNHRAIKHCSNPTNKNGVFHVKHAVRFPQTTATIKPSSSPIRGTFRSRADSAQVRPPALPAQTRPSPAHNRSRRSATRPVRSARSAASQRPCRATH